jgi:DNA-binding MarR family transcriptional regulator
VVHSHPWPARRHRDPVGRPFILTIKTFGVKCMRDTAPPEMLVARCRELWEAMERFDEAAGRTLGVGRTDLRALNLLEFGPLTAGEIGERLGLTSGSVTALIDRLARAGFVSRWHPENDRRRVVVELAPATFAAFAAVYAPLGARLGGAIDALSPAERAAAAAALRAMAAAFDAEGEALAARTGHG